MASCLRVMPRRARPRRTRRPTSAANSMLEELSLLALGAAFSRRFSCSFGQSPPQSSPACTIMHVQRSAKPLMPGMSGTLNEHRSRRILTFSNMSTSLDIWNLRNAILALAARAAHPARCVPAAGQARSRRAFPPAISRTTLAVPHNTMSSHLSILTRAGLVSSVRHGRTIAYRADLATLETLTLFLLQDCCGGKPELCASLIESIKPCCAPKREGPCSDRASDKAASRLRYEPAPCRRSAWHLPSGGDRGRLRHHGRDADEGCRPRASRQYIADRRHPCRTDYHPWSDFWRAF